MPQFAQDVFGRGDYAIISEIVEPGSLVLDLGCGEGELLAWLRDKKDVRARGVEIAASKVQKAIARGVSAYQSDIEDAVAGYQDQAFDYVILSQTLQEIRAPLEVLRGMLRIGRRCIVAFPNFGHWRVRWSHLVSGRAPQTELFPHSWHESPNTRFLTIEDFESLAQQEDWHIEKRIFLRGQSAVKLRPNLLAQTAVYLFSKKR